MQTQLNLLAERRTLHKKLVVTEQQAFDGAKSFYYCFLPVVMAGILIGYLFILEQFSLVQAPTVQMVQQKGGIYHQIILNLLSFVFYYLALKVYIKCQQIDTTPILSVPDLKQQVIQNGQGQNFLLVPNKPTKLYCNVCKITCDYRTKHCRKCQVCIQRYDHHCFWIGNCVGRHNHKPFYLFLLYQTVNNILNFVTLYNIYLLLQSLNISLHLFIKIAFIILLLLAFGFIVFTGYLFFYHSMLIMSSITTWEHMRRKKINYLKHLPKGYNPYSKGVVQNIKEFMNEPTRYNGNQAIRHYDTQILTFEESERTGPVFNLIDNQYYSCC